MVVPAGLRRTLSGTVVLAATMMSSLVAVWPATAAAPSGQVVMASGVGVQVPAEGDIGGNAVVSGIFINSAA